MPATTSKISERLKSVGTSSELHELLTELVRSRRRWTRAQVLFYLPAAFHGEAAEYFDGERLRMPRRRRIPVGQVNRVDLQAALDAASEFTKEHQAEEKEESSVGEDVRSLAFAPPTDERDVVGHMLAALVEEIRAVEQSTPKRHRITDGACMGPRGGGFAYMFKWSSDPELNVPGTLEVAGRRHAARVGVQGSEEKTFEIITDAFLGTTVAAAIFRIDPSFILRAVFALLNEFRWDSLDEHPVLSLLFRSPKANAGALELPRQPAELNTAQRRAIAVATAEPVSYIWGPPGTGKTTTLGALARALVADGKRVLVLSAYNVAVDQAILSAGARGEWKPEQVVRFGRTSKEIARSGLGMDDLLEARASRSGLLRVVQELLAATQHAVRIRDGAVPGTVRGCLESLGAIALALAEAGVEGSTVADIVKARKRLANAFRMPEERIIAEARLVGTTVALGSINMMLRKRPFDHLIIDESSVLRTPEAVVMARLFAEKVTFVGDPRQLPAIGLVQSAASQRWFRRHPFAMAGIDDPRDAAGACVLLDIQHRMAPPIRKLVSELFYADALRDGNCPEDGRVVLVDTSATPARATTRWIRLSPSRHNQVHRDIVASLLAHIHAQGNSNVLVLSPFRAQKIAYEREANTRRFERTKFGTVHTSQGSEADVVVLDLVAAPGRGRSRFLDDKRTPELPNLLNVGMSRAKRELYVIAHADYIREEYEDSLLATVLAKVQRSGSTIAIPADLRMAKVWSKAGA